MIKNYDSFLRIWLELPESIQNSSNVSEIVIDGKTHSIYALRRRALREIKIIVELEDYLSIPPEVINKLKKFV